VEAGKRAAEATRNGVSTSARLVPERLEFIRRSTSPPGYVLLYYQAPSFDEQRARSALEAIRARQTDWCEFLEFLKDKLAGPEEDVALAALSALHGLAADSRGFDALNAAHRKELPLLLHRWLGDVRAALPIPGYGPAVWDAFCSGWHEEHQAWPPVFLCHAYASADAGAGPPTLEIGWLGENLTLKVKGSYTQEVPNHFWTKKGKTFADFYGHFFIRLLDRDQDWDQWLKKSSTRATVSDASRAADGSRDHYKTMTERQYSWLLLIPVAAGKDLAGWLLGRLWDDVLFGQAEELASQSKTKPFRDWQYKDATLNVARALASLLDELAQCAASVTSQFAKALRLQ